MTTTKTTVTFDIVEKGKPAVHKEVFELPSTLHVNPIGLGKGTFGCVAQGTDTITGEEFAIKKFLTTFVGENERPALLALREILLLSHFDHPNIVQLRDIMIPVGDLNTFDAVYVLLKKYDTALRQLCCCADLQPFRRNLMFQLLRGMRCIHSARVVHRDLKSQNILVSFNAVTNTCDLVICDFGSGRGIQEPTSDGNIKETNQVNVTTLRFLCPESILKSMRPDGHIDKRSKFVWSDASVHMITSADVWSIGCVMAEILLGTHVFQKVFPLSGDVAHIRKILEVVGTPTQIFIDKQRDDVKAFLNLIPACPVGTFEKIFRPEVFENRLEIDLLERMLRFDPSERITIKAAMEHEYFKGYETLGEDDDPSPGMFVPFEDEDISVEQCRAVMWYVVRKFQRAPYSS